MTEAERERYREIAIAIRALIPALKDSQVAEDLGLLAARYDKLAKHHEVAGTPQQVVSATPTYKE